MDCCDKHLYSKFRRLFHQTVFKHLQISDCPPLPLKYDSNTYLPILIKTFRRIQRAFKTLKSNTLANDGAYTQIKKMGEQSMVDSRVLYNQLSEPRSTADAVPILLPKLDFTVLEHKECELDELPKKVKKRLTNVLLFLRERNLKLTSKMFEYVKSEVVYKKIDVRVLVNKVKKDLESKESVDNELTNLAREYLRRINPSAFVSQFDIENIRSKDP
mmetsp:Transcript_10431/g.9041  ORF Transcript_10431/g.9041 Transcript_10431/m.9041 type:complete len:216 (-) Transcript_10431:6-653(-)